jgi:Tol biopolymer transport system component
VEVSSSGRTDVYVFDVESGAAQRLTAQGTGNGRPEWSPAGDRILYISDRGDSVTTLWWQPADGSGEAERLVGSAGKTIWEGQLSPDGKTVIYRTGGGGTGDIWYAAVGGGTDETGFATTRFNELAPRFSPDGRWVAYYSTESGGNEVYVRPFPGPGAQVPVSVGGGAEPVWSPDGRAIFYASGPWLVAASVATTPSFSVIRREVLFERVIAGAGRAAYDVSPDGEALLMLMPASGEAERIVVVRDWVAELHAAGPKAPSE